MDDFSFAAAAILWGLLPGLLLLYAVNPRWSAPERVAAAPGLSLAAVAFCAYAGELVRLPVSPAPVLALAACLCGLAFVLRRLFGGSRVDAERSPAGGEDVWPSWTPWLVMLLPLAIVPRLEPVATLSLLPPSLHDGLDHANWFRLIYETRSLNPHEVLAPPLGPDGAPSYYPWGLHAWLALVAHTTTLDPIAVLTRSLVLVSAVMPLSIYTFTAHLTGRGWTAIGAATFSVGFWWLPFQVWSWGGYPLLAGAVAALPLCRLALWAVEDRQLAGLIAASACGLGLLLIHPSQAMLALLAATIVSVTLAASRELTWRAALPFLLTLGVAGLVLAFGEGLWEPLGAFMTRADAIGAEPSRDPRFAWPLELYLNNRMQFPSASRITFGALCLLGAGFALVHRRARPLLALHVAFSLLIPLAQYLTWVTSLWYHLPERLWYAQYATLPALAAVGIGGLVHLVAAALRRWIDLSRWELVAWPLALFAVMSAFGETYDTWARGRLQQFALRNPHLTITDRRVLADFEWIRAHVPQGEILFNAPADWGLPLPFTGHRTVFWSGGYAYDPLTNWNRLLRLLRRGDPYTSQAAASLAYRGITYVYAGALDPALEAANRLNLDGGTLRKAAGLELLYDSPTATVFQVRDDDGRTLLGLRDSARIRFEGFHPVERLGHREWRWTAGRGRMLVTRPPDDDDGDCFLRVFGPDPAEFRLTVGDRDLEFTPRGFRLPDALAEEGTFEVTIAPGTATRPPGASEDTRELGVRVRDVSLACPQSG